MVGFLFLTLTVLMKEFMKNLSSEERGYYKDMGYWIADERKSQGIKQKDFAKAIDISPGFICEFEKGKRKVSAFRLWQMVEFLGCY